MMKAKRILGVICLLLLLLLAIAIVSDGQGEGQLFATERASCREGTHFGASYAESRNTVESSVYSSPCIHKHWEGVIFPIDGQPGDVRLRGVTLEVHPHFFTCMVRNFTIDATATFTLENSSSIGTGAYTLSFPFSTHALYGDHNLFRDIRISVDGTPIPFEVAMDHRLYELRQYHYGELYYKGRQINLQIHPLITETVDIRSLSPFLVEEGFDMIAYWPMEFAPHEQRVVQVEYTSNSNDFSSCCYEVVAPTHGIEPYHFYFDLSNASYWQDPTNLHILLEDSGSAIWSAVPQLDLERVCSESAIEFWGEDVLLTEDLAIPAEPDVFGVTPRCWPPAKIPRQEFSLKWLGGSSWYTRTEVYGITSTTGVTVENVELPHFLSEVTPTASFTVALNPMELSDPAYFDVFGEGSGYYGYLYQAFVRVPITGHTVTGHDLAITNLGVSDTLIPGQAVTITGVVENRGSFYESDVLASLYVNRRYVKAVAFPGLDSGKAQEIGIGWIVSPTVTYLLEVEIEPIPGEVNRHNNAANIALTNLFYVPIVLKDF